MKPQSSSASFPRLTAVALLVVLFQLPGGAPKAAVAGPPIRGTPIDSPPETNGAAPPRSGTGAAQASKGYLDAGFDKLGSFPIQLIYEQMRTNDLITSRVAKLGGPIPDNIRAFDKRKVAVKGFMLPLQMANGLSSDFILLRSRLQCCFGTHVTINEWVHVSMGGRGIKCVWDTPITVLGTLHVGEYRENATMLGIYRLDGEKLDAQADP